MRWAGCCRSILSRGRGVANVDRVSRGSIQCNTERRGVHGLSTGIVVRSGDRAELVHMLGVVSRRESSRGSVGGESVCGVSSRVLCKLVGIGQLYSVSRWSVRLRDGHDDRIMLGSLRARAGSVLRGRRDVCSGGAVSSRSVLGQWCSWCVHGVSRRLVLQRYRPGVAHGSVSRGTVQRRWCSRMHVVSSAVVRQHNGLVVVELQRTVYSTTWLLLRAWVDDPERRGVRGRAVL